MVTQVWPILDRRRWLLNRRFPLFAAQNQLLGVYPLIINEWPPLSANMAGFAVPLAHYVPKDKADSARFYALGNGKPYAILEAWVLSTGNSLWWTDRRIALTGFAVGLVGAVVAVI